MFSSVEMLTCNTQVRHSVVLGISIDMINVLPLDGSFTVLLDHKPSSSVPFGTVFLLFGSTLVRIVLLSIIAWFSHGAPTVIGC